MNPEIILKDDGKGMSMAFKDVDPIGALKMLISAQIQIINKMKPAEESKIIKPTTGESVKINQTVN